MRQILRLVIITLAAAAAFASCNLDGEGAFYNIAEAIEISTDTDYQKISKVLSYDGTTVYVRASERLSYKTDAATTYNDVDFQDFIDGVQDVVYDGTEYYILTQFDAGNKVYSKTQADSPSGTELLSISEGFSALLTSSNNVAYALFEDNSAPLKIMNLSADSTIEPSNQIGKFIANGSFMVNDGTDTHLFINDNGDKIYHTSSSDAFASIVTLIDVTPTAGDIRLLGGISFGTDVYVYGYDRDDGNFKIYEYVAGSLGSAVASLSTSSPVSVQGSIPSVVIDDGSISGSEKILIYLRGGSLVVFTPDTPTLDFTSDYDLGDKKILDFYHDDTNNSNGEFFTATLSKGLFFTTSDGTTTAF
jgi:hypothetical protein